MVPPESHCPARGTGAASSPARGGGRKERAADQCGPRGAPRLGTVRGKVLEPLGREVSTTECARVPGQNTPKSCWRGQLGTYGTPRAPWGLPGRHVWGWGPPISLPPGCHGGKPSVTLGDSMLFSPTVCRSDRFFPIKIAARAGNEKINLAAQKAFCSFNMQLKCDGKRHRLAVTDKFRASIKLPGAVLSRSGCQAVRAPSWGG